MAFFLRCNLKSVLAGMSNLTGAILAKRAIGVAQEKVRFI